MRRTLASLIPTAAAMVRVLQWVAFGGFWRVVMRTTRRMKTGADLGGSTGSGLRGICSACPHIVFDIGSKRGKRGDQDECFHLAVPIDTRNPQPDGAEA